MLRRVARFLRGGLFAFGVVIVLLLPVTFGYSLVMEWRFQTCATGGWLDTGVAAFGFARQNPIPPGKPFVFELHRGSRVKFLTNPIWPEVINQTNARGGRLFVLSSPLWLLAFLCLAWPVTSFLLARRRRGRGFPVEVTSDGQPHA